MLGVSLNVPLFSSLARSSRTQRAKINLDIADIQLKETEERLSLEAKMARSDYQLSIENYQTAKKNLDLAEKIEKKQRIKFVEGISSSFDLALENALNIPLK